MSFLLLAIFCSFLSPAVLGQSVGTVRLYRNGVADTSQSWSSGIVQIFYTDYSWGNICDDEDFGSDEADVICHQLGYTGASSYSNAGTTRTWGTDTSETKMSGVYCLYSSYLAVTQCSFSTSFSSSCSADSNDVTVSCYSTRIWSSPTTGDIRLTGGTYSNQGLLEVYCNGQWGTVCDDYFFDTQAQVACRQLGYNYYDDYNHLSITGDSSQPIYLRYLYGCTSGDNCLTQCGGCPSSGISGCSHYEDVTLQCEYLSSYTKQLTTSSDTCIYYDNTDDITSSLIGIIVASAVGFIICIAIVICVPICICLCMGVGIGAAARSGTRASHTFVGPPSTTVVSGGTMNTQQSAYYPTDPNFGGKTDVPPGYFNQPAAVPPQGYDAAGYPPPPS